MRKVGIFVGSVAVSLGLSFGPSIAAPFGTFYVDAESGTDSGTCGGPSLATVATGPCATLNQALQNASPGNNIVAVHGGAFGPIFLTGQISITGADDKSLQIINSGAAPGCIGAAPGTCAASTTAAIQVAAGANDNIKLKDLIASAGSAGTTAIQIDSARGVSLTGVAVRGGSSTSTLGMVNVTPSSGTLQLYIHNSDIGFSATMGGVALTPSGSAGASVEFSGGEIHHAVYGLQINATSTTGSLAGAFDSTQFFSFNNSAVSVNGTTGVAQIVFSRSTIVNTGGAALRVSGANAHAEIFEDVFTGNGAGVNILSGAGVVGFGNSMIFGNGTNCLVAGVATACSTAISAQPMN
jgi:hypothetical protein